MLLWNCLVLLLSFAEWTQANHQELVWLEDLNSDHDLRDLKSALPTSLRFNIKRLSDDPVKLQLQENKRLNANAPVYVGGTLNGKHTAIEADVPLITDTKFYHDRSLGAAVKVSCAYLPYGVCQRVVEGSIHIDGDSYEIEPSPTAYNIRAMETKRTIPHILRKVSALLKPDDKLRGLYGADYKYITDREGDSEHDHKEIPEKPKVRNFPDYEDNTPLPGRPQVPLDLLGELRTLFHKAEIDEDLQKLYESEHREKRADGKLYAVEIVMVVDSSLWDKYYAITEATDTMNKDTATMFFLRERLAHIINGVSLRYEEIEDPELNVYVTISQFLIYKSRNASNPLPPNVNTPTSDGITYADSDVYIEGLPSWVNTAPLNEHDDHVMVMTGYELYYGGSIANDGVVGVAYMGGACGNYRVSLQEDWDYFVTTSVTAHELGHNLGSVHDGSGANAECGAQEKFIMAPYVASFKEGEEYSLNPWRFSACSIKAFKNFFNTVNCFLDHGDYYDKNEWENHNKYLPGERYSPLEQCKLVRGDNSKLCSDVEDELICRLMTCFEPKRNSCIFYAAARGTPCGIAGSNKWCIDGQCVKRERTDKPGTTEQPGTTEGSRTTKRPGTTEQPGTTKGSRTTEQPETTEVSGTTEQPGTTEVSGTTEQPETTEGSGTTEQPGSTETTAGSCIDIGWYDWTCQRVSKYFYKVYGMEPSYWCYDPYWGKHCCAFCNGKFTTTESPQTTTPVCVDIGYYTWSCKRVSRFFKKYYNLYPYQWCSDPEWKENCCNYCARRGY